MSPIYTMLAKHSNTGTLLAPSTGMEDYFLITFRADGINYTAKVFPDLEEDGGTFYQVSYDKDKTIFLRPAQEAGFPKWRIKEGDIDQPEVSADFVHHAGSAIESHEE